MYLPQMHFDLGSRLQHIHNQTVKPMCFFQQTLNDSSMQEEIRSLKAVLELKSAEVVDLRHKAMQLEDEVGLIVLRFLYSYIFTVTLRMWVE